MGTPLGMDLGRTKSSYCFSSRYNSSVFESEMIDCFGDLELRRGEM
jgi:hypothetical protein